MPSFSSLYTSLSGEGVFFQKNSRHASFNFNQESASLYRNQPRLPFEYYININLNNVGTASSYISQYFNNPNWSQVMPLVKSIEMPSFKIDTVVMNQYNRKRISQKKIEFDPVKVVFHDVADGKTLKFWEMYYRYYFADGDEPGKNTPKQDQQKNKTFSVENFSNLATPGFNPAGSNLPTSIKELYQSNSPTNNGSPTNTDGNKSSIQNIIADKLDNHNFGFNLQTVDNIRNLIQSIDIFQVHAGRFNQVTLVNPRVSSFSHDKLDYAVGDETLELQFTFEYEYAYYTIQNMKLGGGEPNNSSTKEQFEHGKFLELPSLAFNASLDFAESNNPILASDNPVLQRVGKNVQSTISGITDSFAPDQIARRIGTGVLDGIADIQPKLFNPSLPAAIQTRPFVTAARESPSVYKDVNRISSKVSSSIRDIFGG